MKKITSLIVAIVVVVTICLGFYFKFIKTEPSKAYHKIEKPTYHNLSQYITASGTLRAVDQFIIGSLEAGRVIEILVDDNDSVKKGQTLAILDNGIGDSDVKRVRAQLREAQARLTYQTAFYKRQQALYNAGQLAQDTFERITRDYEIAQSNVNQISALLEVQEQQYNNLFIKAPDDGVVIAKNVEVGQTITSRLQATVLFNIAKDLTKMEVSVDVDEADVGLVKKGQTAMFTVDSFPRTNFTSQVKEIRYLSKTVNNVISFPTILEVDNPTLELRPGMTTNVEIIIADNKKSFAVPNSALRIAKTKLQDYAKKISFDFKPLPKASSYTDKAQDSLWIIENNTIREVAVELGIIDERYSEITKGITESNDVIVELFNPSNETSQFLQRAFKR